MSARSLHFNAFIWPNGYHESAWRVVDNDVRGVLGLPYYAEIARIAERGLMDSVFLADNIAIPEYRVTHLPQTQFDPVAVLSTLPRELATFAEHVVPVLQSRGRFRTEYAGSTLRDHLGLGRPAGYQAPDA
ncbi:MAG: hypothetical protein ACRDOI_29010 [Trebonia sp.]